MKKSIWLALALCMAQLLHAQEFKFTLGPGMAKEPDGSTAFFNTTLKKGYFLSSKGFSLSTLDDYVTLNNNAKEIKSEIFTGKQKAIIEGYHTANDKNYIIYSTYDKDKAEHIVYMQELSSAMALLGSPIRIATFKNAKPKVNVIVIGSPTSLVNLSNLHIAKPESKQQIVLVKERDTKLEVKAFSPEKGELWTKTFDLNSDYSYKITSVRAAENGNVYIAGYYFKGEKALDPFLLAYAPAQGKFKLHTITSGEKIKDFGYQLELVENETPVFAGLYSKKQEAGYQIYKIKTDNLELERFATQPFSPAYYDILYRNLYKPEYFNVAKIAQLANKNLIIDIEGGLYTALKYSSSSYTSPLFIAAVGTNGSEKWYTIVQKYQVQPQGDVKIGHYMFCKNNKVLLVYNDNNDNFDLSPTDKQKEDLIKKNIYIATTEIDENGSARKLRLLTTDKKQNASFNPEEVKVINSNLKHFLIMKDDMYYFATLEATSK